LGKTGSPFRIDKEKDMKSRTWIWITVVSVFVALVTIAQAEVVYTPVNVNLPTNGYYTIDLNHDGIADFTFHSQSSQTVCGISGGGPFKELTVRPNVGGGVVGFLGGWADALLSGVQIDSYQSFLRNTALMYDVMRGHCPHNWGIGSTLHSATLDSSSRSMARRTTDGQS
jgi:hypothetical protein